MSSDFHKRILWSDQTNIQHALIHFVGKKTSRIQAAAAHCTHERATEMRGGFVPAGATGSVLTHVDVIHQSITIQETFP